MIHPSAIIDPKAEHFLEEPLVWEVVHGMSEKPDVKCPVCGSKASKSMMGHKGNFHFKGDFLKNTQECKHLANIHKLENDDPYAHMREPGEADDKVTQIKKQMKREYKKGGDVKPKALPRFTFGGKKNTTLQ